MATSIESQPIFNPLGTMLDSGRWHENLTRPDRITVFFPTGSDWREQATREALWDIGLTATVRKVNGPYEEKGDTSVARAVDKAWHVADVLGADGYLTRHPADLTIILSADSRNAVGPQKGLRDKPRNPDELMRFGEEWERIALGELTATDISGYAALVIYGNSVSLATLVDRVRMFPHSREVIQQVFRRKDTFDKQKNYAHGLGYKQIEEGGMTIVGTRGEILLGNEAINRVMGASQVHLQALITSALRETR